MLKHKPKGIHKAMNAFLAREPPHIQKAHAISLRLLLLLPRRGIAFGIHTSRIQTNFFFWQAVGDKLLHGCCRGRKNHIHLVVIPVHIAPGGFLKRGVARKLKNILRKGRVVGGVDRQLEHLGRQQGCQPHGAGSGRMQQGVAALVAVLHYLERRGIIERQLWVLWNGKTANGAEVDRP